MTELPDLCPEPSAVGASLPRRRPCQRFAVAHFQENWHYHAL